MAFALSGRPSEVSSVGERALCGSGVRAPRGGLRRDKTWTGTEPMPNHHASPPVCLHVGEPRAEPPAKANVLLVDDRPANLLALEAVLDNLGHNLVKAASGAEALELLRDRDFAVV